MKYCVECGEKLVLKELGIDGLIPFCPKCNEFRFPIFNQAVSMVIVNKDMTKTLLIKQYGKDKNILVAGYVSKGESLEECLKRELFEEVGLTPYKIKYQKSEYFAPSNTVIANFLVIVDNMDVKPNEEVDSYNWFTIDEGEKYVFKPGLAGRFYQYFLDNNYEVKNEI